MSEMIQVKEKIYKTHYNDWSSIQSFVYEVESVIAEKAELGYQNIKIDSEKEYGYDDDGYYEWYIYYNRPMTPKELEAKMKRTQKARESAKKQKEKKDAQEKELFEKLKKKWGLEID